MRINNHYFLRRIELFAQKMHAGQFRRDGKTPYFSGHVAKVAALGQNNDEKIVGFCHDLLEDTEATIEDLQALGCTKEQIKAVELLTKKKGVDYLDYIGKIKQNPLARAVKINDINCNLADDPTDKQKEKYGKVLEILKI